MDDENDLDNIFEEYENEDVQESANEPIHDENAANPETNEGQTREVVPVPKRVIRNPRLKFNAERLCGERGIPIVTKHFKNVKFKGKGHEKEDLNKLLSSLEHWTHRLFPSMKFEACLRQIEKLGKKRAVQTCMVKIRKDMPILKDDFVHDYDEDEQQEEALPTELEELPTDDAFDRLFGKTQRADGPSNLTSTPQSRPSAGNVLGSSFGSTLTEEQRKRMEYNKTLAAERRKAKMASTSTAENSGRQSTSVLDPGFLGGSNASTHSQTQLEEQFDSLFDEPKTHENASRSHSTSATYDQHETQTLSSDTDQQFESLFDAPMTGGNSNRNHSESNRLINEDQHEMQKISSDTGDQFESLFDEPTIPLKSKKSPSGCSLLIGEDQHETQKLSSDQQFESLIDEATEKGSSHSNQLLDEDYPMDLQDCDDTKELSPKSLGKPSQKSPSVDNREDYSANLFPTCEDPGMSLRESVPDDSLENNKLSADVFGNLSQNTEAFENNDNDIVSEKDKFKSIECNTEEKSFEIIEDFEMTPKEKIKEPAINSADLIDDIEMNSEEPIDDSVTNSSEQNDNPAISIEKPNDSSKMNQCRTPLVENEIVEELGLDELMDLVDEDAV